MSLDVTAAVTAPAPMPQLSRQASDLGESGSVEPLGPGWTAVTVIIGVMWSRTTPVGSWLRRIGWVQVTPASVLFTYTTSVPFVAKLRLSVQAA